MAPYTKPLEPSIAAQVAVLCSFPKVGFQVRDVRCGWEDAQFADRFTVHVPCGWDKLEWYVQFNGSRPWDPPDVIFHSSPDGLCFQPLLFPGGAGSEGSSWGLLKDWQHNDSYRLLRLLLHLRALFLQQQRQQAEAVEDGRVKFELSTLAQQVRGQHTGAADGCWGVLVQPSPQAAGGCGGGGGGVAGKWIGGVLRGAGGCWWVAVGCWCQGESNLRIKFPISGSNNSANGKASTPQLKLGGPPLLLSLLGFPETKLPAWTDSMCTVAYLPELAAFIHQRLDSAVSSMQSRADFISALPAQLFSQTTLFVSANSCICLVRIALPPSFPQQQPSITLQSIHNRPVASEPISNFPWSPRWSPAQMAQRLCSFLEDESVAFKRFCIDVSRAAASART
ncbi:unnamed protein product [Closterium sp. Yama58-4]|nr:unnamed protein product [Closterium sp. Yama58-4]